MTEIPEDPQKHPQQTVDALEEKINGQRRDESDTDRSAFEQDIDPDVVPPEDLHRVDEPPA